MARRAHGGGGSSGDSVAGVSLSPLDAAAADAEDVRAGLARLFRLERYRQQLLEAMMREDADGHYGISIRLSDLAAEAPALASELALHSDHVIDQIEQSMKLACEHLLRDGPVAIPDRDRLTLKMNLHARIESAFTSLPGFVRASISGIRSTDMNRFVTVSGTVIRTGLVRVVERERWFACADPKCCYEFAVKIEIEHDNTMELPRVCPNPSLPAGKRCTSSLFKAMDVPPSKADYQEVKIQEPMQALDIGCMPRSIVVVCENDLVDLCKAGDDVTVTGTVLHRWGRTSKGARCDLELLIRANHITIATGAAGSGLVSDTLVADFRAWWSNYSDSPYLGRDLILRAFCPQLHALSVVKLAVMLVLIGGVGKVHANGTKTRGEPHLLLIGDPGTGKSQILRYACKIITRSVLTTGVGTTSAGLTCSATRDGGAWMLEAGALVLADRGLCCIDEFSSIREHDRATIHEAMEQQTLSVAKVGLVCKLNARCTIIAATNPKGKYDPSMDVVANTAIASPLLSRFDVVMLLMDTMDPRWDRTVSDFILRNACARATATTTPAAADGTTPRGDGGGGGGSGVDPDSHNWMWWTLERLKAYVAFVRTRFEPQLEADAQEVLRRYYQLQRRADSRSAARTTLRMLESLVRLTQAHARLMSREVATVADAVVAVSLMESSMFAGAVLGSDSVAHTDFVADPDSHMRKTQAVVLARLGLTPSGGSVVGGGGSAGASRSGAISQRIGDSRELPTSWRSGGGSGGGGGDGGDW